MNYYRDTHERMTSDSVFRAVVMQLAATAEQHGFTPGELRQMAFEAALIVEARNPKPFILRVDELEREK